MLPIVDEKILQVVMTNILQDISSWRKSMIHYIKEENPEINAAIVEIAAKTELDPKAVATGAYTIYKVLEAAASIQEDAQALE